MLGVTSINRCEACNRVHQRLARATGLVIDDLGALAPDEAAAHAYGQALAVAGPIDSSSASRRAARARLRRLITVPIGMTRIAATSA